jgi:hypothetical protein
MSITYVRYVQQLPRVKSTLQGKDWRLNVLREMFGKEARLGWHALGNHVLDAGWVQCTG